MTDLAQRAHTPPKEHEINATRGFNHCSGLRHYFKKLDDWNYELICECGKQDRSKRMMK